MRKKNILPPNQLFKFFILRSCFIKIYYYLIKVMIIHSLFYIIFDLKIIIHKRTFIVNQYNI
jgi:hypothetical protein